MIACVVLSSSDREFASCAAIRHEVFVLEQHVPDEEEMDDLDERAIHVLATMEGAPVGTGRLILESAETARIGRMAVLRDRRRQGIGRAMLERLTEIAVARGVRTLTLAGQLHAIPFYERFGFVAEGGIFLDAGIEHRTMRKQLG